MKILFLTDNFPPEYNAPATRTFEHCKRWVEMGAEVTVITCFPNFPQGKIYRGYKNSFRKEEVIEGIRVIRVWSFISSNKGFFKRTLDFISFSLTSFVFGFFVKTDIIIATSPQFFTAISGFFLSFFRRKKWIMEVRDLWPESIVTVGAVKNKTIILWLERLELFLYRNASAVILVTDSFKNNLINRGIKQDKLFVIKNGANLKLFSPNGTDLPLRQRYLQENKFTLGYIGTHGLAHNLSFILDAINEIEDETIQFLFIGDGAEKQKLLIQAEELDLKNVIFLNPIEKNDVPKYLSIIDASLVPLMDSETFKSVIPSKIFESAAMLKPIFLGVRGESKEIVENYKAGLCFEPENKEDFIEKLKMLKAGIKNNDYYGGCKSLSSDFNRHKLGTDMLKIIKLVLDKK